MAKIRGQLGPGFFIFFRTKKFHSSHGGAEVGTGIDYLAEKQRNEQEVISIIMAIYDEDL